MEETPRKYVFPGWKSQKIAERVTNLYNLGSVNDNRNPFVDKITAFRHHANLIKHVTFDNTLQHRNRRTILRLSLKIETIINGELLDKKRHLEPLRTCFRILDSCDGVTLSGLICGQMCKPVYCHSIVISLEMLLNEPKVMNISIIIQGPMVDYQRFLDKVEKIVMKHTSLPLIMLFGSWNVECREKFDKICYEGPIKCRNRIRRIELMTALFGSNVKEEEEEENRASSETVGPSFFDNYLFDLNLIGFVVLPYLDESLISTE